MVFSYEEIAVMLDVKINSVKQKLYRAHKFDSLKSRRKILMESSLQTALQKAKRKQVLKLPSYQLLLYLWH